jgi:hypothetical protein
MTGKQREPHSAVFLQKRQDQRFFLFARLIAA